MALNSFNKIEVDITLVKITEEMQGHGYKSFAILIKGPIDDKIIQEIKSKMPDTDVFIV